MHFRPLVGENKCSRQFLNWRQEVSTRHLHCYGFASIVQTKKETTPNGVVSFLVETNGLEPSTSCV